MVQFSSLKKQYDFYFCNLALCSDSMELKCVFWEQVVDSLSLFAKMRQPVFDTVKNVISRWMVLHRGMLKDQIY